MPSSSDTGLRGTGVLLRGTCGRATLAPYPTGRAPTTRGLLVALALARERGVGDAREVVHGAVHLAEQGNCAGV